MPSAELLGQLRDIDPGEEVLVSDPLPRGWRSAPPIGAPPLPPVHIVLYRPERVVLETDTPEAAVLVLSDTFDPRWHAWDNGQRAPIVRANHALRAVFLAPGAHRVEFRYSQPSVFIGLGVTLVTLALLGAGGILAWRRRRRAAGPA